MKDIVKTKADLQDLNNALMYAVNRAMKVSDTEDGGTCNFDSVTLRIKIPAKLLPLTYAELSKMHVRDYGHGWKGSYTVGIPLHGQGNLRTRMAEAACAALQEKGYDACMFYTTD